MAKQCVVTGRKTKSSNNRSHAMNKTKRKVKANLQKKRVIINGKEQTVLVSARALKSGKLMKKANIKLA